MHTMDDKRVMKPDGIRRRHADGFRQALVQRTLEPGASVAAIAQEAGVNANLLFNWRRLHLQALAPAPVHADRPVLLPVTVVEPARAPVVAPPSSPPQPPTRPAPADSIEIAIHGARVCVRGAVDEVSLCTVLRALAATA
jgi:transposase